MLPDVTCVAETGRADDDASMMSTAETRLAAPASDRAIGVLFLLIVRGARVAANDLFSPIALGSGRPTHRCWDRQGTNHRRHLRNRKGFRFVECRCSPERRYALAVIVCAIGVGKETSREKECNEKHDESDNVFKLAAATPIAANTRFGSNLIVLAFGFLRVPPRGARAIERPGFA